MRYSVVDFLVSSLLRWIFSEKHPLKNAEYAPGTFVQLLMNAAQAKDYVETISGLDKRLPNVDTLFWRLSECASRDLILREYKKVVKRHIEAAKGQIRRRRFIIAIVETHEPFYGKIKNLWIHDYRNGVKGATGSYKYDKIFRYVRYYKKRWGIETTFRVQDEVKIKTKSLIPMYGSHSSYSSACCIMYGSSSRGVFRSGDLLMSCSGGT
ncbi:MAG: hypothetical protein WBB08_07640 [Halobacteriota archaeon]